MTGPTIDQENHRPRCAGAASVAAQTSAVGRDLARLAYRALQALRQAGLERAEGPGHGPKNYLSASFPGERPQMDYVPQEYLERPARSSRTSTRCGRARGVCAINRELLRAERRFKAAVSATAPPLTDRRRCRRGAAPRQHGRGMARRRTVLRHDRGVTDECKIEKDRTGGRRLRSAVDAGPGAPQPGEYRASICAARQSISAGMDAANDPDIGSGLGVSGAQSAGREDFKTLVADVSMGQVERCLRSRSRLACSKLDRHRLLEPCALTNTLVIDADGCYDPADFNEGLLLGLKGTMAQAELHFLRGRLLGGKPKKAQKGELRDPLPVGDAYDDANHVVMDPDAEVQGAITLAFHVFLETGSAYAVVQRFATRSALPLALLRRRLARQARMG